MIEYLYKKKRINFHICNLKSFIFKKKMSAAKKTVYVIYYSMYGHIEKLARHEIVGLEKAGGKFISLLKVKTKIKQTNLI